MNKKLKTRLPRILVAVLALGILIVPVTSAGASSYSDWVKCKLTNCYVDKKGKQHKRICTPRINGAKYCVK